MIVPCQPEMSKADIDFWLQTKDDHMPNIGGALGLSSDFTNPAAPAADDLADELDPMQGGGAFVMDPDGGGSVIECDVWAQDCPKGEKCAAWASDGGSSWNANRCVPVADDPVAVGETCIVEGTGTSGVDNCDATSMCWDADAETNEGTCVELCTGSEAAPMCGPEGTACSIANEGVLILCLPICNPLADECAEGQGCYPVGEFFQCAPDASGDDSGAAGDPCEFLNACDDGTGCVSPDLVPECPPGSPACCSSFCEIGDDSACQAGQECLPWYDVGQEPDMCLEGIGICSTPA